MHNSNYQIIQILHSAKKNLITNVKIQFLLIKIKSWFLSTLICLPIWINAAKCWGGGGKPEVDFLLNLLIKFYMQYN